MTDFKFVEIKNKNGMRAIFTNVGATLYKLFVKDAMNNDVNVVLAHEDLEEYLKGGTYFGATIGPTSGRISKATFNLNNQTFKVDENNGSNHLHGGLNGFSFRVFDFEHNGSMVIFHTKISDMEDGYPGDREIKVKYELTNENELVMSFFAYSSEDTIMNITNHSYFNLGRTNTILDHELYVSSSYTLDTDDELIAHDQLNDVTETLDFRQPKKIRCIEDDMSLQEATERGSDHCFILDKKELSLYSDDTKIKLDLKTSYPSVVLYTFNYPEGVVMKERNTNKYAGIAIECQYPPNGINLSQVDKAILRKDDNYKETITYRFSIGE
jgi:aldose 1-epimerase